MTKSKFAAGTEVPVERSKAELERTLVRYGATAFVTGWDSTRAVFEAIATGHVSFEEEFLAQIVLEGGQTVGDRLIPDLDALPSAGPLLALGRGA